MTALVCRKGQVERARVPVPALGPDDALVEVAVAGLCRTDVQVARGLLPARSPVILGHEIAGRVVDLGERARVDASLAIGEVVTVDPRIPCGRCRGCASAGECTDPRFLGVDVDGGFAERLRVPARSLVPAPGIADLRAVAYVEPVAATLAILGVGIEPGERGVIVGSGRIAALAGRVLELRGFAGVVVHDPDHDPPLEADAYDFAIETRTDAVAIAAMIRGLRRRGLLVLKSRRPQPITLPTRALLHKELRLAAAYYGAFAEAVDLVRAHADRLSDLWAPPRPLADFAAVLNEADAGEGRKLFFAVENGGGLAALEGSRDPEGADDRNDLDGPEGPRCAGSSAPSA